MTFQEAMKKHREALDKYEQDYLKHHESNPEDYPLEADEGSWVDDMLCYLYEQDKVMNEENWDVQHLSSY